MEKIHEIFGNIIKGYGQEYLTYFIEKGKEIYEKNMRKNSIKDKNPQTKNGNGKTLYNKMQNK